MVTQPELGVDPDCFFPDEPRREAKRRELGLADRFTIGFVGRLTESKGVRDLFAALSGLQEEWALLMLGDGDLRRTLEAQAESNGWPVCFPGHVPAADVPDFMRAMDCLVLPSRTTPTWQEQFGLVLAQAMLCGVPVIGSSSGAIPEVIGDAGLVFPEGDDVSLRACLSSLAVDASRRSSLAKDGFARGTQTFSTVALASETADLIRQLRMEM